MTRQNDKLATLKRINRCRAVLLLLVLAVGAMSMWWTAQITEKRMRVEMLNEARIAAQAINMKHVLSLSGSEEDLSTPDYEQLKEQLVRMRHASPHYRFLYLMGRRADGAVFFFVDSMSPDSEDYALPGLVYEEISDSYLQAFDTRQEAVVGPVTDRWGTLVTALVPLIDPQAEELVAVLGMDIEAGNWNWKIIRQCLLPFTGMLLLAILLLAIAFLRESETRFRELFENMRSGVAVYEAVDDGEDFIFKNFNKGAEKIDGVSRKDVIGKRVTEAFPGVKKVGIFKVFQRVWRTGKPEHFPDTMYSDERITGWRENYVYKLPSGDVVAIYDDITDRKKAEEEIKSHQKHIALINQILCHDLTNDLVVIQSALNLYNKSPEEEFLKEISSHTKKSLGLINRMRELEFFISRHSNLKPYKMNDAIDEVIKNYPSIDFEIKGMGLVMADDSLSSVIDNIVRNAVIHGKADRITITTDKKREMCEVRIADNGSGIPDEIIKEKVFEEGFIHGDTGHTGIGLHIVQKAMESYGGYAYVKDNEPKGAVFVLRFRMVK